MTDQSTFMRLREDEREVRKALIMEAAMKLFEEKLFHEIGMRDIAKEAGVSPASVIVHFKNKTALLEVTLYEEIEAKLEKRPEDGGLWTGAKVAKLIGQYLPRGVSKVTGWKYLRRLDYTLQVPKDVLIW